MKVHFMCSSRLKWRLLQYHSWTVGGAPGLQRTHPSSGRSEVENSTEILLFHVSSQRGSEEKGRGDKGGRAGRRALTLSWIALRTFSVSRTCCETQLRTEENTSSHQPDFNVPPTPPSPITLLYLGTPLSRMSNL